MNHVAYSLKYFAHLVKPGILLFFQLLYEEVLSHNTLLDTITAKSSCISENFVTQLELQDLQERHNSVKDNVMVSKVLRFSLFLSIKFVENKSSLLLLSESCK